MAQALAHDVLGFVRLVFSSELCNRTPYNGLISYLLRYAMTGSGVAWELDFNKVMVSQGSLKPVKVANATVSGNAVNFAWTNNAGSGEALASDIAIVLAFNKDDGEAEYVTNAGVRGDGQCQLALPSGWEEASLAVYLGFRNADTENCADSLCLINTRAEGSSSGNQSSGSQSSGSNSGSSTGSDGGSGDGDGGELII